MQCRATSAASLTASSSSRAVASALNAPALHQKMDAVRAHGLLENPKDPAGARRNLANACERFAFGAK